MSSDAVRGEMTAVLQRYVEDHNAMWRDGTIAEGSSVRDVEPDLRAVQHYQRFPQGVWRAESGEQWLRDTAAAAAALHGQGCRWSLHDVVLLPRSESECAASYRVVHHWGDGRPPAQALFLETWRKGDDGTWRLARHVAEKA